MKKLLLLSFTILMSITVCFAQIEKGDSEFSLSSNFNFPTEGDGGNGNIAFSVAKYLTPNFSAGVSAIINIYTGPDLGSTTGESTIKYTPFIGIFGAYNFLTAGGKAVPYLAAQYDFSIIEGIGADGFVEEQMLGFAGGKVGFKYFMTENINFDANVRYQALVQGPEGYEAGNIGVNFGIGVILPKKK